MGFNEFRNSMPDREVVLRYITSALGIIALILLYISTVQGSAWSLLILFVSLGAFVARMFVGPTEHELRAVAGIGKAVGSAGRFIRRRIGKCPPPFDCHCCGAKNAPELSYTDACEYCGALPISQVEPLTQLSKRSTEHVSHQYPSEDSQHSDDSRSK